MIEQVAVIVLFKKLLKAEKFAFGDQLYEFDRKIYIYVLSTSNFVPKLNRQSI